MDDAESDEEEDIRGTDNTIVCQFEKVSILFVFNSVCE